MAPTGTVYGRSQSVTLQSIEYQRVLNETTLACGTTGNQFYVRKQCGCFKYGISCYIVQHNRIGAKNCMKHTGDNKLHASTRSIEGLKDPETALKIQGYTSHHVRLITGKRILGRRRSIFSENVTYLLHAIIQHKHGADFAKAVFYMSLYSLTV